MDGQNHSIGRLTVWMFVALSGYVLFAVTVRTLSRHLSIAEICALRSAGASVICLALAYRRPGTFSEIRRISLKPHLLRSVLHVVGTLAIVLSIVYVPFGIFSALEFTGPIFAAMIVFAIYRTLPSRIAFVGLLIILCGAITMIAFQYEALGIALLLPVVGTFILTSTNMMLRPLARGHSFLTVLLLMNIIQLPIYLVLSALLGHDRPLEAWTAIDYAAAVGVCISGLMTQLALAKATKFGSDLQISALDTMRIPTVSVAAYFIFAERLSLATMEEIVVIIIGALVVALGRVRGVNQAGPSQ